MIYYFFVNPNILIESILFLINVDFSFPFILNPFLDILKYGLIFFSELIKLISKFSISYSSKFLEGEEYTKLNLSFLTTLY